MFHYIISFISYNHHKIKVKLVKSMVLAIIVLNLLIANFNFKVKTKNYSYTKRLIVATRYLPILLHLEVGCGPLIIQVL